MHWQRCYSLIILLIFPLLKAEILTISKYDNVGCVLTGNSCYSAVYIDPFDPQIKLIRNSSKIDLDLSKDWNSTKVNQKFSFRPVIDHRWENFRCCYSFRHNFRISKDVQSFSIYTKKNVIILDVYSSDFSDKLLYYLSNSLAEYHWIHFGIKSTAYGFNVYVISENNTKIDTVTSRFQPRLLRIRENVIKYHNYTFFFSSRINNNRIPKNYLIFLDSNSNKCISMFVSVDKNCYLDIFLKSGYYYFFKETVNGFNEELSLKQWIRKEIKFNVSGNVTLTFVRRRKDDQKMGFWAIDNIQYCKDSDIVSTVISTNKFKKSSYICNELTYFKTIINNKTKSNFSIENIKNKQLEIAIVLLVLILLIIITFSIIFRDKITKLICFKRREMISSEEINLQNIIDFEKSKDIAKRFLELSRSRHSIKCKIKNKELEKEFCDLPIISDKTTWEALRYNNRKKNRKKQDCLPYDSNRVILENMIRVGEDNYINASYINSYNRSKAYIACQSPKFNTVKDFWRMVWQEKIEIVVMATNFIENDKKRMCAEYWPQGKKSIVECGAIAITLIKKNYFENYTVQTLEVSYNDESRTVQNIHLKWDLDIKNTLYPNDFMPVIKEIRKFYEKTSNPILIHSGFGTNRTGTLILCDMALQMIKDIDKVNIYELTEYIREQRSNIINTKQHYILAHLIIAEYLMKDSSLFENYVIKLRAEKRVSYDREQLTKQLNYIAELCEFDAIIKSWSQTQTSKVSSTFVNGYGKRKKFLVLQQPTTNEKLLGEFWMLLADHFENNLLESENTPIICIFLNKLKQDTWPNSIQYSEFTITFRCLETKETSHYYLKKVNLLIYNTSTKKIKLKTYVFLYELKEDKNQLPASVNNILYLISDIKTLTQNQIVVAYDDGVSLNGIFLVLLYLIEKYENESEIDVCGAIRNVRRCGTVFIKNLEQLKFLYDCVLQYFETFQSYNYVL